MHVYDCREVYTTFKCNLGNLHYVSCLVFYYFDSETKFQLSLSPYVICIETERPLFNFCK